MPSLKKRRHSTEIAEVTFAAERFDLSQTREVKHLRSVLGLSVNGSRNPWKWYEGIGEVHYAVSRNAKVGGYSRLHIHKRNPDGSPGDIVEKGPMKELTERLQSPYGGRRGLIENWITLSKVPGDAYLIRCRDGEDGTGDPDGYDFIAANQINLDTVGTKAYNENGDMIFEPGQAFERILLPYGNNRSNMTTRRVLSEDFLGRVWRPSAHWPDMTDSPLGAAEDTCELLYYLTKSLKGKLLSRFAMNGILAISSQVTDIAKGVPGANENPLLDNTVMAKIKRAIQYNIDHLDDAQGASPILAVVDDVEKAFKHIIYDQKLEETDMALRGELLDRVIMALDVQTQTVRGVGDSNHWSAWAVSDDERRIAVQPDIETMCWALTRLVLHPELSAIPRFQNTASEYMIWYDATPANVKTNLAEDSRQLDDRGLIAPGATRRMSGVEERDAPSELEAIQWFGRKNKIPYLAFFQMNLAKEIDWDQVVMPAPDPGPLADSPAGDPISGPGVGDPGSPNDQKGDNPKKLSAVS